MFRFRRNSRSRTGRILLLLAMTAGIFVCAACGKQQKAPWLPSDVSDKQPAAWTADLSGADIQRVVYRTADEKVTYQGGDSSLSREAEKNSLSATKLTLGDLPAVLDAVLDWAKKEQPGLLQQDFSCAYAPPGPFYQGTPNGLSQLNGRGLVYSLSGEKITALSGAYAGSAQYGAVTVYTQGGNWTVLVDD